MCEEKSFPVNVIAETTAFCNLRCPLCPQPNMTRERGVMDRVIYDQIVDEIAKESPETALWPALMGEFMLLGEDAIGMVKYAVDKGVKICVNTNGNFYAGLAHMLIKSGVSEVYVSLDAATPMTYNVLRAGGKYDIAIRNLIGMESVKGPDQKLYAQFIVSRYNEFEVEEFIDYWRDYDVYVKIKPYLNWAEEQRQLGEASVKRTPCKWLMRHAIISWDGRFLQCDGDYEGLVSPGDIRSNTIKEVWNGELKKRRDKHRKGYFSMMPCKHCEDWAAGMAELYHGGKRVKREA